jgi:hypothetical protein
MLTLRCLGALACFASGAFSLGTTAKPPVRSKPTALPCRPERCCNAEERIVRAVRTGVWRSPKGPDQGSIRLRTARGEGPFGHLQQSRRRYATGGFALSPIRAAWLARNAHGNVGCRTNTERFSVVRLRTSIRSRWHLSHLFSRFIGEPRF